MTTTALVFVDQVLLRRKNVRRKLNAMALEFADKNVLMVDGNKLSYLSPHRDSTPL